MDFIILDFDIDLKVLFILRHPFLVTGHSLIDVSIRKLTICVYDKVEVFNVYKDMKLPTIYE